MSVNCTKQCVLYVIVIYNCLLVKDKLFNRVFTNRVSIIIYLSLWWQIILGGILELTNFDIRGKKEPFLEKRCVATQ